MLGGAGRTGTQIRLPLDSESALGHAAELLDALEVDFKEIWRMSNSALADGKRERSVLRTALLPVSHHEDNGQYEETILANVGKRVTAVQNKTRWLSFRCLRDGDTTGANLPRREFHQTHFKR